MFSLVINLCLLNWIIPFLNYIFFIIFIFINKLNTKFILQLKNRNFIYTILFRDGLKSAKRQSLENRFQSQSRQL